LQLSFGAGDAADGMTAHFVRFVALAGTLLSAPGGADAQTRTVVVPAGATVVVPPRGSALPRPVPRPVAHRPRLPPLPPSTGPAGLDLVGAGMVAAVVLPAIAAAAITAALSDGGGSGGARTTSGPVRTR
jgi:hypothetical protein